MAKQRKPFVLTLRVDGVREITTALRDLPADASEEVRAVAWDLSQFMATRVKAAGAAEGRQAALVATTVRARKDRVPNLVIGGSTRLGRNGTPAYSLLFGSEFGAGGGKNSGARYAPYGYNPHAGKQGRWIFPTVERHQAAIGQAWYKAANRIVDSFGRGT